jgi:hypothetical protein
MYNTVYIYVYIIYTLCYACITLIETFRYIYYSKINMIIYVNIFFRDS